MKRLIYLLLFLLAGFTSCQKDQENFDPGDTFTVMSGSSEKVTVCHSSGNDKFKVLQVNRTALASHLKHGDYILDADGDGYSAEGACAGTMNDCDDNDAAVYPGAPEICRDGKDNNCDGVIDEGCGPDFNTFYVRNSNATANRITAPWNPDIVLSENAAGDGFSFSTPMGGQKVGYGTTFFDGYQINTIETVNWNLISGNAGISPYLNIWVADGAGNYAVIASENSYNGTDFSTRREWKIFEYGPSTGNFNWLFDGGTGGRDGSQYLTKNGQRITLSELSDRIIIGDPKVYPSPNVGTGAPRGGSGFNLIWGDTQSNFTQKNGQIGGLTITVAGSTHIAAN